MFVTEDKVKLKVEEKKKDMYDTKTEIGTYIQSVTFLRDKIAKTIMMELMLKLPIALYLLLVLVGPVLAFQGLHRYRQSSSLLNAEKQLQQKLTPLPKGISPFEKSLSKNLDTQAEFRKIAKKAVDNAIASNVHLLELEFPPLLGGDKTKSQFDDFDNIQELDSNKDWTLQFAPLFVDKSTYAKGKTWLIFPDIKECELARKEWQGQRYQGATFTTIEAATEFLVGKGSYSAPWGAAIANGVNGILGGGSKGGDLGLLGDKDSLDPLVRGENAPSTLNLVIQPGNGGPVEDWINCEKIYDAEPSSTMVIVNGALDKVRDGYYPAVFFPKLASTVDRFYKKFESAFYLKPISDKGVYGWLYRVYPEPWQVVLQKVRTGKNGEQYVEDIVVSTSTSRPSYSEAVNLMLAAFKEL
jgi:hypothetical protein